MTSFSLETLANLFDNLSVDPEDYAAEQMSLYDGVTEEDFAAELEQLQNDEIENLVGDNDAAHAAVMEISRMPNLNPEEKAALFTARFPA